MNSPAVWQYYYSDALSMRYAIKGGRLVTEDKTEYTANEADIIKKAVGEIDPVIHGFKRVFEGEIVSGQKHEKPFNQHMQKKLGL